jgi:hypothetical protein
MGYGTHLNEQNVPVKVCPEISACSDIGEFLRRVEEYPRSIMQRIIAAEVFGVPLYKIILYERSLYLYHIHQVQATTPSYHHARVVFFQRLLTKMWLTSFSLMIQDSQTILL